MSEKVRQVLNELQRGLRILYGSRLVHVILFGSQARGDAGPGSDIDVLVVLKGPVDPNQELPLVSPLASRLSLEHEVVICCVYLSEEEFQNERSPLLLNVRREGVIV